MYHLALGNDDFYMNYGIFESGDLLVETYSKRYLKEISRIEISDALIVGNHIYENIQCFLQFIIVSY